MVHVKLTEEEIKASVAAANDVLNHMQMKQRVDNSYAMALHARDEIRKLQPLSIAQRNQLSYILPHLYSDKMHFDRYYGAGSKSIKQVEQSRRSIANWTVQLQHLLGDIVHERTHPWV